MPDEEHRVSEKFRAFLDKEVAGGRLTMILRDGTLCTLDGKPVRVVEVMYDLSSGEIDEMHLEKVQE